MYNVDYDVECLERLSAEIVSIVSDLTPRFRLGSVGYTDAHLLYSDACKVAARIRSMKAQKAFKYIN